MKKVTLILLLSLLFIPLLLLHSKQKTEPFTVNVTSEDVVDFFSDLDYTDEDLKLLKQRFNESELAYITHARLTKEQLTPYLSHPYLDLKQFNSYEDYRLRYNITPFEAVNLVHEPLLYPHEEVKGAIFTESFLTLVNRNYYLPKDYENKDLVLMTDINLVIPGNGERNYLNKTAYDELKRLFYHALNEGLMLFMSSGYRSFERQSAIYYDLIQEDANNEKYSARPGHSEHQTGFSVDLTCREVDYRLLPSFEDTKEGQFIKENAYHYGFIIRYPKDKEWVTGYAYEPWHLRYIGREVAKEIFEQNLTLEEYILKTIPFPPQIIE